MSGHHEKQTTTVAVGTPPNGYSYEWWKTTEVHFHGFADLPSARNVAVESHEFECFGHQWRLELYPGGEEYANGGMVGLYLILCSDGSIDIEYCLIVNDKAHLHLRQLFEREEDSYEEDVYGGDSEFAKQSDIMDALIAGTLIIEVRMKLANLDEATNQFVSFIPENPLRKSILKKFMDEESADVLFQVVSKSGAGRGARKRVTSFHAHHLILQDCAPTLAELCKSATKMSPVRITDVKPDTFRHMLYYVYGGKLSGEELEANAQDIIDAADKYSVVNLKLEAEACYASSIKLTVDNMLDILLYADAKNCALLKEVVMDFMVEQWEDIVGAVSFENVPSYMMADLLTAMGRRNGKDKERGEGSAYNTMRVGELRKILHEKGLDNDGSREVMIALLKESS